MVIRRVRAKQRGSTGGRPKKIKTNEQERERERERIRERERRQRERSRDRRSSDSGSDSQSSFNGGNKRPIKRDLTAHHHFNHNNSAAANFNPADHKNNFGRNRPQNLQPLKIDNNNRMPSGSQFINNSNQFQQQFLNQLSTRMRQNGNSNNSNNNTNSVLSGGSNSTDTILPANLDFNLQNIPQFIAGLGSNGLIQNVSNTNNSNNNPTITMPKLIADNGLGNANNDDEEDEIMAEVDGVKQEYLIKPIRAGSAVKYTSDPCVYYELFCIIYQYYYYIQSIKEQNFTPQDFVNALQQDLATLMRLQDNNNNQQQSQNNNNVTPEDIKKPLQTVRKRLLTMLDRKLYHQLNHPQKVIIAKANLIAGICTAAIHTGYCKDALALYRQALTLFRELNEDAATNEGYVFENDDPEHKNIHPFILNMIKSCKEQRQDRGKYSMFIVVIYYQMSLLYDKSLIEKVQKSRYYLIQALNLLVLENAMNSNKYCIETLQRLALFALETGKDDEYIAMMCITLSILKKCEEKHNKILDVEIHFVKNLLSYGRQLGSSPTLSSNPEGVQRFEAVKAEYQKLLTTIISDAKNNHKELNTETRKTLSKLLELATFLLNFEQLNESYKIYHCMRQICDNTQINLDLEFMKVWLSFVKNFITNIVKTNTSSNFPQPLWHQQLLELCEFDTKVLEKIKLSLTSNDNSNNVNVGIDLYQEYVSCANALIAVNSKKDKNIATQCQQYLEKAMNTNDQHLKNTAMKILQSIGK